MKMPKNTRLVSAAAMALAAVGLVVAPSVASRSEPSSVAVAHRFVPTTVEIAPRDEEAAPTF
jgi:Spy/CpxP family protein refolding chaperone